MQLEQLVPQTEVAVVVDQASSLAEAQTLVVLVDLVLLSFVMSMHL
jgi:hypothetical protein